MYFYMHCVCVRSLISAVLVASETFEMQLAFRVLLRALSKSRWCCTILSGCQSTPLALNPKRASCEEDCISTKGRFVEVPCFFLFPFRIPVLKFAEIPENHTRSCIVPKVMHRKLVAHRYALLFIHYRLLWGMVTCCVRQLGFPGGP